MPSNSQPQKENAANRFESFQAKPIGNRSHSHIHIHITSYKMPINFSLSTTTQGQQAPCPCIFGHRTSYFNKLPVSQNHVKFKALFCLKHSNKRRHNKAPHNSIDSLPKFDTSCCYSAYSKMEGVRKLDIVGSVESNEYSKELDVAVRAVQMACFLCQKVQESLISKSSSQVQSKDDNSPVTVAGNFILFF